MITQILAGMRDVDGVHGSFVVNKAGVLAGKDLPPMFDDTVLHGGRAPSGSLARRAVCGR